MCFHPRGLIVVAVVGWVLGDSLPCQADILANYSFGDTEGLASTDTNAESIAGDFDPHGVANRSGVQDNIYLATNATGDTEALALADTDYCTFTVTADDGMILNLSSLDFDFGYYLSTGSINNALYVQSSVDGLGTGGTVIGTDSTSGTTPPSTYLEASSISLADAKFQGLSSITFRFSFSDDRTEAAHIVSDRLDNVVLNGSAVPEPSSAALLALGLLGLCMATARRKRV